MKLTDFFLAQLEREVPITRRHNPIRARPGRS
jgi:hypothetical protein